MRFAISQKLDVFFNKFKNYLLETAINKISCFAVAIRGGRTIGTFDGAVQMQETLIAGREADGAEPLKKKKSVLRRQT